ncbi:MAG: ABC transporter permease [Pyrinomonadaceae bacterium]
MNTFSRIISISKNTFREAIRDRVLYNLVVFVLLITASAILLGELTAGNEAQTIVNVGLAAVLIFGVFIAIFVGVGLVSKEIEKRTLYALLSKPVSRAEFLLGKYFGLCLTLLVNVLIMGGGITLALLYVGGGNLIASAWYAVILIYFELTIVTAIALMFSSFSTPALSALLTFLIFVIGHLSTTLRELAQTFSGVATRFFVNAVYYLLPNLKNFEFATNASHGEVPSSRFFFGAVLYAIVYVAIIISLSIIIFSRKNLK